MSLWERCELTAINLQVSIVLNNNASLAYEVNFIKVEGIADKQILLLFPFIFLMLCF